MSDEIKTGVAEKSSPFKSMMTWVGAASALIGLGATLFGGVRWFEERRAHETEVTRELAVAELQAKEGDLEAAVGSYAAILKQNPGNAAALKEQLAATMTWTENFSVSSEGGQSTAAIAGPKLDEIIGIFDAALARSHGEAAADVQAHLGWAHWLNQRFTERESGPVAGNDLRAAVAADANNVYANAMLGNWMLQNNGDLAEAIAHLRMAAATGKARPFVREWQVGGLLHVERPGARAEMMRVMDAMRKGGEPLDDDLRRRVFHYCCYPPFTEPAALTETLSAVSQGDAWSTFLWLYSAAADSGDAGERRTRQDYVAAELLEIAGKRDEALAKLKGVSKEVGNDSPAMEDLVDQDIKRLSQAAAK